MPHEPTPKSVLLQDGPARLLRFRSNSGVVPRGLPLLLVPSMINRWYVMDLRKGASMVEALVEAGLDVWCLDWGIPHDEDRYFGWDDVLARLARMERRVRRETGAPKVGVLGYCMGATLAGIHVALHQETTAALINLAGPFDFAEGGLLATMVDAKWFSADDLAAAGNISPEQMQSGFQAMRPTQQVAKMIGLMDRGFDPKARESFDALEEWANDNIPFPAAAYATYISELYQKNLLVKGEHWVGGRRVDLSSIEVPILTIGAERDTICPLPAARGLHDKAASTDKEILVVPGGHVGAVVGSRASKVLYPAMAKWLKQRLVGPVRAAEVQAQNSRTRVPPAADPRN